MPETYVRGPGWERRTMVPNDLLRHSHVRTPHGQGLNVQVEGEIRFGMYMGKFVKSFAVLIAPVSRHPGSGFRMTRTIQHDDGTPPKRSSVPGVHATMEDAYAEFVRWSMLSLTLNLPLEVKREHLKEGAYFYAGRYGDDLCRVLGVSKSGEVHYANDSGNYRVDKKEFLARVTTPAGNPAAEEIARIDEAMVPKPKVVDPFQDAVRREGALDWSGDRYYTESDVADGRVWRTEKSETQADLVSLFRRDSTPPFLWKPDEYTACAVARNSVEAWILAEMLEGSSGVTTAPSDAYSPTYVDGERRGWVRKTETGHLTLHQGSDEDPRDVVVTQFSTHSPYEVMHVAWLKAPRKPGFGVGPWDRGPIKDADLMGAALGLTEVLVQADRLGRPLEKADWKAWQHGLGIDPGKPAPGWDPPARGHGCPRDPEVVEASLELLERDPQGKDDLYEAGKEAYLKMLPSFFERELPFQFAALSRDVSAQYTLAADLLGKDKADDIALSASAPTLRG